MCTVAGSDPVACLTNVHSLTNVVLASARTSVQPAGGATSSVAVAASRGDEGDELVAGQHSSRHGRRDRGGSPGGHGTDRAEGRVDHVRLREVVIPQVQLEGLALAELPAETRGGDVGARGIEDRNRGDRQVGDAMSCRVDEANAAVRQQPRCQARLERPRPGPATDAAVDGEEVLGIVGAERDRLGAERRRAPLAVGMALPVGIARGTGGQPDALVSLPLDDQAAGVDAGGRRAGPNRSRRVGLLRAQRAEQEGRGCVRLVAGVASGHEEAHSCRESGEPQERQQRRMPGVCRALRRPQFFVDRHVS